MQVSRLSQGIFSSTYPDLRHAVRQVAPAAMMTPNARQSAQNVTAGKKQCRRVVGEICPLHLHLRRLGRLFAIHSAGKCLVLRANALIDLHRGIGFYRISHQVRPA